MHQSPTSKPMSMYPTHCGPVGLTRFGSAPGSLLSSIADSVIGGDSSSGNGIIEEFSAVGSDNMMERLFSGDSPCLKSESICKAAASPDLNPVAAGYESRGDGVDMGPERSYGLNEIAVGDLMMGSSGNLKAGSSSLIRHSSSPAGLFSQLMVDNGFSVTGVGNYPQAGANRRLKSQLSFSSRQDSLSQISEISIPDVGESTGGGNSSDEATGNFGQSYISSFPMGSWDETKSIVFSAPSSSSKRVDSNGDIITALGSIDSHQFSLPNASLEMASVEKLLQIHQDSVPCKIRAKRGYATHPRSIAERERRTRISEKLRKLQELVPNMDKQTNTADMLDLAVQHIKELQGQVQKLNEDHANCTCACKHELV